MSKLIRRHPQAALTSVLLVITLALAGLVAIQPTQPAQAALTYSGSQTAKAGTGGVTAKTFVRLEAAGTVYPATAVGHYVVGVAEKTAAANAMTSYAPMGTVATVTSGEIIAVGDLLTTGTGGKAFVLVPGAGTQRVAGMALTAAGAADVDTTVLLLTGVDTAHLDPTADVTMSADKNLTTTAGTGYIQLNGAVSGAIKLAPIATGTATTTIVNSNGSATTLTLPTGTDTLVGRATTDTLTNKTLTAPVISGGSIAAATSIGAVGATSGGITIAPIATGTATATIQNQNVSASTITLPSATCTLPGLGLANTWSAAQTFSVQPKIPSVTVGATGTIQADAAAITTGFTLVTGSANAGVRLPATTGGDVAYIKNNVAGNMKVWPTGADAINALGASNSLTMATLTSAMFISYGTTWYTIPLLPS